MQKLNKKTKYKNCIKYENCVNIKIEEKLSMKSKYKN